MSGHVARRVALADTSETGASSRFPTKSSGARSSRAPLWIYPNCFPKRGRWAHQMAFSEPGRWEGTSGCKAISLEVMDTNTLRYITTDGLCIARAHFCHPSSLSPAVSRARDARVDREFRAADGRVGPSARVSPRRASSPCARGARRARGAARVVVRCQPHRPPSESTGCSRGWATAPERGEAMGRRRSRDDGR